MHMYCFTSNFLKSEHPHNHHLVVVSLFVLIQNGLLSFPIVLSTVTYHLIIEMKIKLKDIFM